MPIIQSDQYTEDNEQPVRSRVWLPVVISTNLTSGFLSDNLRLNEFRKGSENLLAHVVKVGNICAITDTPALLAVSIRDHTIGEERRNKQCLGFRIVPDIRSIYFFCFCIQKFLRFALSVDVIDLTCQLETSILLHSPTAAPSDVFQWFNFCSTYL